jgi:hypothetical protein
VTRRTLPPPTATVGQISAGHEFTSLNSTLLTPDVLHAVCRFDPAVEVREEAEYFRLRYRVTDSAVVVASTGWAPAETRSATAKCSRSAATR